MLVQSFVATVPPSTGNSGVFDFSSSKFLLEAPQSMDKQLVKPLLIFDPALLYFWCKNKKPIDTKVKTGTFSWPSPVGGGMTVVQDIFGENFAVVQNEENVQM